MAESKSVVDHTKEQAVKAAVGAGMGAVTRETLKRPWPIAAQIGSAMGAAAVGGAGVYGTLAAGGTVVTAKVAAGVALATAAAPVVIGAAAVGAVGCVGYGIYKLFKSK